MPANTAYSPFEAELLVFGDMTWMHHHWAMGVRTWFRIGSAAVVAIGVIAIAFGGVLPGSDKSLGVVVDEPPVGSANSMPPRVDVREFANMPGGLFGEGQTIDVAAVDMATWATYSNPKFGYSFRYPLDWLKSEGDSTAYFNTTGRWLYPLQSIHVEPPFGRCPSHECNAIQPSGLGFYAQVSTHRCDQGFEGLLEDEVIFAAQKADRCLFAYFDDPDSRILGFSMAYPYTDATSPFTFVVSVEHGSGATANDKAILAAILSTLAFSDGTIDLNP